MFDPLGNDSGSELANVMHAPPPPAAKVATDYLPTKIAGVPGWKSLADTLAGTEQRAADPAWDPTVGEVIQQQIRVLQLQIESLEINLREVRKLGIVDVKRNALLRLLGW